MKRSRKIAGFGLALSLAACGRKSPTSPDNFQPPDGTYRSVLKPVAGPGVGGLSVTPVPNASRVLDVVIKVRLEGAKPNATYLVQRAPEVGRANAADGVCQRALGQSPWSPSDPPAVAFVTFPLPVTSGPLVAIKTQPNGNGSVDFEFVSPTIPTGTVFDVMLRLVDDATAPSVELRSECLTVTAQ